MNHHRRHTLVVSVLIREARLINLISVLYWTGLGMMSFFHCFLYRFYVPNWDNGRWFLEVAGYYPGN